MFKVSFMYYERLHNIKYSSYLTEFFLSRIKYIKKFITSNFKKSRWRHYWADRNVKEVVDTKICFFKSDKSILESENAFIYFCNFCLYFIYILIYREKKPASNKWSSHVIDITHFLQLKYLSKTQNWIKRTLYEMLELH